MIIHYIRNINNIIFGGVDNVSEENGIIVKDEGDRVTATDQAGNVTVFETWR